MSSPDGLNRRPVVLLVEDDKPCRMSVTALLECVGFDVVAVSDGETAIATLQRHPQDFDAIFLDVVLPGISGVETFRALRGIKRNLPIVLTTGYGQYAVNEQFDGLNYDGFVPKPAPEGQIETVLISLLKDKPGKP